MGDWSYEELVILVPILKRAHRVGPLMDSVRQATPGARVMFVCTPGDDAVIDAVESQVEISDYALSPWPANGRGDYARKINMGYRVTDQPLMFLGADDLAFTPGWFERATSHVHGHDARVVVGTSDGHNARTLHGILSTHSLVTRAYADQFGVVDQPGAVLHEGYWHEYVDNELCETAKARRRYAHAADAVVEHLHPDYGLAPNDEVYEDQRHARQRWGRRVFHERSKLWR